MSATGLQSNYFLHGELIFSVEVSWEVLWIPQPGTDAGLPRAASHLEYGIQAHPVAGSFPCTAQA